MAFPIITAQEAAEYVKHGDNLGISGFTAAGTPKVVPAVKGFFPEKLVECVWMCFKECIAQYVFWRIAVVFLAVDSI